MTSRTFVPRACAILALGWASNACRTSHEGGETAARAIPTVSADRAPQLSAAEISTAPAQIALSKRRTDFAPLPAEARTPTRDARREACGSLSQRLAPGSGERPSDDDRVVLDYAMYSSSGDVLDSSAMHGEPLADSVRNLGPGLPCVVKGMKVGESRRVWVGAALRPQGDEGPRSVPARDLVFELTLRELTRAPPRPIDYAAPPATSSRTASGLAFRVLHRGSGERHPVANSRVTISHSGWTNRGVLFASSRLAGVPASFVTHELPTGLSEGIQLMRVGDKMRFWMPERLAYQNATRSAPKGPVVFDVELLAID